MSDTVTHIGMDLGAYKTSVMSSNGRREVLPTALGWAKDVIARSVLGRDVVFGEEAFQQLMSVHVVRPFARGALKYLDAGEAGLDDESIKRSREAARLIVQHAVAQTQPPPGPVHGVIGAPSRATLENKEFILDAVAETFDAVMIIPEPFAVAYGMNLLTGAIIVDIGAGTIDICPMYGAFPDGEDQFTIAQGGDTIDEELCRLVTREYPGAELTLHMARDFKERFGRVGSGEEHAVVEFSISGTPRAVDVTDALQQACTTIVQPIIDGLAMVISRLNPELRNSARQNILLAGGGSQIRGLDRLIESELQPFGGGRVRRVPDCQYAGAAGALKLAMSIPHEQWPRQCRPAA